VVRFTRPPFGTLMPQSGRRPQHHKRTFGPRNAMSALPPKADIAECDGDVRFVPKADILRCGKERRYSITTSTNRKAHFSHSAATIMTMPIVGIFQMIERAIGKSAAYRNA